MWVPQKDYENAHVLTSRFVYQIKQRGIGIYEPHCRWTPRGFQEREGIDYDETFANVPTLAAVRMLLLKILLKTKKSFHFDFKGAFSNTPLDREILVSMPKGYHRHDKDGNELILSLRKSVYGLKQSGHDWEEMLKTFLLEYGFKQSITEPMLYTKSLEDGSHVDILVWVDDVFGACDSEGFIVQFLKDLNKKFGVETKHLGPLSLILGMEIEITNDTVSISQLQSIEKLLKDIDMEDCQERDLPLPPSFKIEEAQKSELLNPAQKQQYQSIVGSCLWINRGSRPDISFAVWVLTRNMHNPTEKLLEAAKYLVRFLKKTKKLKLTYSTNGEGASELNLHAYTYDKNIPTGFCDANWEAPSAHRQTSLCAATRHLYGLLKSKQM